ncbi:MAG TPA: RNA methyltransferase [Candidatus Coprenecus stercoripullorum]|nr:RNA methyltransferase [Candidatus Coprenecus stercoripullorum]
MFRKLLNSELGRPDMDEYRAMDKTPLKVVLDNIRSRHNIGSAFRSCDAFKVSGILLCGISSVPPSPEIHKSALGAEYSVDWEYRENTAEAVKELKAAGYRIISIEQTENSIPLGKFVPDFRNSRYAVIFGNEVHGVGQEVVDMSDIVIEIPQYGTKHSLNVSVAVGIVLYALTAPEHD